MIYKLTERPPFGKMILFAIQMVLSVFVASVLIANICGVDTGAALVGAGCGTLFYILITQGKSPMFISNSGAFVAPVIAALTIGGYTGIVIGGLTTWFVYGIFGLIFTRIAVSKIYNIFPPALIGAVTVVIGINLMGFIPTYLGETGQWGVIVALITMLAIALLSHYTKGIWQLLPFLLGILVGYAIAVVLTLTGVIELVDFSVFDDVRLFQMPHFAFTQMTDISFSAAAPIIVMYIAYTISAMMECLSDHAALGGIIGIDLYEKPGLSRIFIGEGCANLVSSLIGGLGACSYGESISCMGFSKVATVWVSGTAAILLAIIGFIGPVQAFIASIPSCVFAGAAIILYSFIAISGVKMLQKIDFNNTRQLLVAGIPLSIGICGMTIGNSTLSISGTAAAVVIGVILNQILREK